MIIVINKDFSVAKINPSTVYQGSNLANELTIFAPFSVISYPTIVINATLPSGEKLAPLAAFRSPGASTELPEGLGVWSMALPSVLTDLSGELKLSLSFYGAKYYLDTSVSPPEIKIDSASNGSAVIMTTGEISITVRSSNQPLPSAAPAANIYGQILGFLSSLSENGLRPSWTASADDPKYIENKPPITSDANGTNVEGNLRVSGDLSAVSFQIDTVDESDGNSAINLEYFNEKSAKGLKYIAENGHLYLTTADGTELAYVDLPLELTVSGAYYDDSTKSLVINFTNGSTANIPLSSLLPEWTQDINTTNAAQKATPPTTEAVKNYVDTTAANAIRANVSGPAIVLDDVSSLDSNIKITTSPKISSLKLFTRNIADISKATAYGSGQVSAPEPNEYGTIDQPWIEWIAGGTYYVQIPMYIPEGCTVSYSFEWEPDNSADVFKRTMFVSSSGGTVFDKLSTRGTFVASSDIYGMRIYKDVPGTGLSGNVSINNICVSLTNYAEYTPFAIPMTIDLSNGALEDTVENNYDNLTLVPPAGSGKVTVSAQYTRDSTLVINKLEKQIAALQTAIAT